MRIRYKSQISSLFIVLLVAILVAAFIPLRDMISAQTATATKVNAVATETAVFGTSIKQFLVKAISYKTLQKQLAGYHASLEKSGLNVLNMKVGGNTTATGETFGAQLTQIQEELNQSNSDMVKDNKIEARVVGLTDNSVSQSNEFLKSVGAKLADPRERSQVSTTERMVIAGAANNTSMAYTVQAMFKGMAINQSSQSALLQYLSKALDNAGRNAKSLAGTPYAQLMLTSQSDLQEIESLTAQYLTNQYDLTTMGTTIDTNLTTLLDGINNMQMEGIHAAFERVFTFILYFAAVMAIVALILIFLQTRIARSITGPIQKAVRVIRELESGNLRVRVKAEGRDETGEMLTSLAAMTRRFNAMILEVKTASDRVALSSEEISSNAQQLAEGAQSQASTLEETSASVEELTASVEQVSDHARSQAASVEESSSNIDQVQKSVEQVSKTLTEVSETAEDSTNQAREGMEAVSRVVEAIKGIAESSVQIAGIVNVISDIADQTNLLALNASIEAARAGQHGRGFAVVADEVSKLADRSASSTKEIEVLIKQSNRNVDDGVQIAHGALDAMNEIVTGAQKSYELVGSLATDIEQQINGFRAIAKATESISEMGQDISAAAEEQTTNAKQVAKAIENVNEVTQQSASAAEQMSSATEELSALAGQMQKTVEQFKLASDGAEKGLPSPEQAEGQQGEPLPIAEREQPDLEQVALSTVLSGEAEASEYNNLRG